MYKDQREQQELITALVQEQFQKGNLEVQNRQNDNSINGDFKPMETVNKSAVDKSLALPPSSPNRRKSIMQRMTTGG